MIMRVRRWNNRRADVAVRDLVGCGDRKKWVVLRDHSKRVVIIGK